MNSGNKIPPAADSVVLIPMSPSKCPSPKNVSYTCTVAHILADREFADPMLNPYHPYHKKKVPRAVHMDLEALM